VTNLPAQQHTTGTDVAVNGTAADPYAIDQTMVKLPSLYLGQFSSKAVKGRRVDFGDIYVGIGAEDPEPQVVGKSDGKGLSEPVRFYVHSAQPGFQVVDPVANYGKRSLRLGTSYGEALVEADGDPRKVFQQTHYTLTIPAYSLLPVRFIMGSRWGGSASRWINTQIAIIKQQTPANETPPVLKKAFQIQTRPTSNGDDDFVDAAVGFADVKAKDAEADQAIVQLHAETLAAGNVQTEDYDAPVEATDAPSLA
jgi:hypothetical protein